MTEKTILTVSLVAIMTVSMIAAVSAAPPWLSVDDGKITPKGTKTFQLTIDASDTIPRNAGKGVLAGFMQTDQTQYLQ